MSEGRNSHPPCRNISWLHSEPSRRARVSLLSPLRILEQTVSDICDCVKRNLETRYSNESSPESETYPNVVVERVFPFDEIDNSLIPDNPDENRLHSQRTYAQSEGNSSRIEENFRSRYTTVVYLILKNITPQRVR